ncbi:MAG TPA: hypothetical protein VMS31_21160 [Pyrinomonadaceae bacterium]|nr:hypothetical protein [Pyrinomonadaceae bacterium]
MTEDQNPSGRFASIRTWTLILVLGGFVALFLIHFAIVWKSVVNLPSDDEWALLRDPDTLSLRWIWVQHNEHRIVTTKFLIWLLYHWDGWNLQTNVLINFIIFGVTLAWLIWVAKKLSPRLPLWAILGFTVFMLSPILWMNHLIGLQVCFHFWLLFFLISTYFLFGPIQNWQRLVIGGLAAAASLYSLGTGLSSVPIVFLLFCLFKLFRAYFANNKEERVREVRQLGLTGAIVVGSTALWMVGFYAPNKRGLAWPYELAFWRQLLNLVSLAFGVEVISTALGAICLLIVIAPVLWQVWKQRGQLTPQQWTSYATVIGILATLASIAAGRAPFGIGWSKVSRYAEIGMPLIILSALNWNWVLQKRKTGATIALLGLWCFCFVGFFDNWSFDRYWQRAANRRIGAICVKAYYQQGGQGRCANLWRDPLAIELNVAKSLNASFYQEASSQIQRETEATASHQIPAKPALVGVLDVANCQIIGGWASQGPRSKSIESVDIYDGDKLIQTVTADTFRHDVYNAGMGAYFSGFQIPTPPGLKDSKPHSIRARFAETTKDLRATPKTITCAP